MRTVYALMIGAIICTGSPRIAPAQRYDFTGFEFDVRKVADGAYALLAPNGLGPSNAGFVIGKRGVLVVDAHIGPRSAERIQAAVRRITSLPILYLVNLNSHGDHTFGNSSFPASVVIVSSAEAAAQMARDFDAELKFFTANIANGAVELRDVTLRLPAVTFDRFLSLDLGGRRVELRSFGPGNTGGDIVAYLPESRIAYTGNLVLGAGLVQPINRELPGVLREFLRSVPVDSVVPGHWEGSGAPLRGTKAILEKIAYAEGVIAGVDALLQSGVAVDSVAARLPLSSLDGVGAPTWREILPRGHAQNVTRVARQARAPVSPEPIQQSRNTPR